MVTVRIKETGVQLDVVGKINYIKKNSDIGDITKANSSFTWQMEFPKTDKNVREFELLGISGSTSTTPYRKIVCQILDNGIVIEQSGNLIITETTQKSYKGHIKAGIIDFLQDISNDNIADVIDLSALSHFNTSTAIINSFTANLPYKYIVANYNGQPLPNEGAITNLNPFALNPSIDVRYLWNKIFEHYGWTYDGNLDIDDLWMTYPEALGYTDEDAIQILDVEYQPQLIIYGGQQPQEKMFALDPLVNLIDNNFLIQDGNPVFFTFQQTGFYNIKSAISARFVDLNWDEEDSPPDFIEWQVFITGQNNTIYYNSQSPLGIDLNLQIAAGSQMAIRYFVPADYWDEIIIESGFLKVETRGVQEVNFSNAFVKIKVKDFFKEILMRNSLTSFVDAEAKHIDFKTINERLDAPAVDWSDKFFERKSEKYVYNNYAQNNLIKHKHNSENEDFGNGILEVSNENLQAEKTLYQSFTFAPEETLTEITTNLNTYQVQNFKMFEIELKKDENEDLIGNFKSLKDRFYFIRAEQKQEQIYVFNELATQFPLAIYSENFQNIVNDKYDRISELINNAKILPIELVLSKVDVVSVDLFNRIYFKQEKAYFLLNELKWKNGETCEGEFIKINS